MTATIAELLAVPALRHARLIVGDERARVDRVIGRVGSPRHVTLDVSAGPSTVLVLMNPVARFDTAFEVLLRQGHHAGVVAVAFATENGITPRRGTVALALRLGIALVAVPTPWEASVGIHDQLTASEAPAVRLARRVAEAALAAGVEVDDALHAIEEAIGRPLGLADASGHPLGGEARFDEHTRRLLAKSASSNRPVRLAVEPDRWLLAVPVGTGISARAWLTTSVPRNLAAEVDGAAGALQTAGIAIGHRLALARLRDERDARRRMGLLDDLRASAAPSPALAQRAAAAGWQLEAWHVGIRIVPRAPADVIALRPEIQFAFTEQDIDAQVVEQDDGWAAWTSYDREPSASAVHALSTAVRRAQAALRPHLPSDVGVGSVKTGARGLAGSLGEAADAARLAANRPESGHFVHIDTLGLAQLLVAWTRTDTFLPAARELLAPLRHSHGDLLATLRRYLDSGGSVTETAAVLDVHRNTVTNRLALIRRLLNVDLDDPETRLALQLATRALP